MCIRDRVKSGKFHCGDFYRFFPHFGALIWWKKSGHTGKMWISGFGNKALGIYRHLHKYFFKKEHLMWLSISGCTSAMKYPQNNLKNGRIPYLHCAPYFFCIMPHLFRANLKCYKIKIVKHGDKITLQVQIEEYDQ